MFLQYLLAAFIVQAAWGFPAPTKNVPPQCVDPTFACQDIENARLCGVVKSCINDVWSSMRAPEDNDDICSICKEMVKEARDQLLSNMTQEEIKEVFEGSCKLIPVKLIADGCIKIVDEFIPELVEMLASRMDPNMVCTVSGLCNVARLPVHGNINDELTCEFCTHVLEHVKELITANSTVEEFRTALLNFCKHTGRFASKCTDFVNEYYDTIFGFIRNLDSKGFCTIMGLCSQQISSNRYTPLVKLVPPSPVQRKIPLIRLIPAKPIQSKSNAIESNDIFTPSHQLPLDRLSHPSVVLNKDIDCALCKAIAFYLKQDIKEDRSKKNVDTALNNVCAKWVKEFPEDCKAVVHKYSLHMKHRIIDGANFDDICFFAKACPLEQITKGLKVKVVAPKNSSSVICDLCKETFDEIENQLKDPSTKKYVENLLSQTCSYLPTSLRDDCQKFIDQNLDTVFNILEEELQADNVCPALRLCPSPGYFLSVSSRKNVKDIECDLCKDFVEQLQERLKDPDVKNSLKNLLEKGCAMLPQQVASECKTFVDQNIDNLINILVQDMDPNLVCAALNLCQNPKDHGELTKTNDIECDFCKEIVQKVDDELKDQRTEEEIKEALAKACTYLPSSLTDKCEHFIDTYSALLISLLAQEMDPKVICTALKLCPDSIKKPKVQIKGIECDLCKEIVKKLDDDLKDKRTVDEIKAALEKVCSYLPSSYTDKCESFINENTDMLVSLLAAELNPSMVCGALKVCPAKLEALQEWILKVKNLECEGCQSFFHYLQNELMDADAQTRIKTTLKKVCRIFPKVYDKNCEAYIDEYGSALLAILAQDIDPSILCVKLSVCKSSNATIFKTASTLEVKPLKMDKCTLCTSVVDYLDKLLEEDDVDKEIAALVEKVCTVIPSTLKEECSTLIETYGPYILQMLGQLADSKQVCQAIDMCPQTRGHVHLLGGKKCTFGPSYWCQSRVHASACKAEMYCKQKVWDN